MVIGSRIVKGFKGTGSGYWMALPALLAIVAIVAYPLAFATYYSFRRVLPNAAAVECVITGFCIGQKATAAAPASPFLLKGVAHDCLCDGWID
jgi:ABC-type sugar transport system permease subunit